MNRDYIVSLLEAEKPDQTKLIQPGDLIDYELLLKLREIGANNAMNYFAKVNQKDFGYTQPITYRIEVPCQDCENMSIVNYTKTEIKRCCLAVKTEPYCICNDCQDKRDKRHKEMLEARKIKYKEKMERDHDKYINCAFNPEYNDESINLLDSQPFDDEIQKIVKSMEYKDFLKTEYWKQVRESKMRNAKYSCQLCGRKGMLHVHHKTYENHGLEHIWSVRNKDLIVLCKDCHEKFHDIILN